MAKYQHMISPDDIKSFRALQKLYPNTSMRDGMVEIGDYHVITKTGQPNFDPNTQKCVEVAPVNYVQTWQISPLSQSEIDQKFNDALKAKLKALDELALEKEQAGINVAGLDISTKREDQFRITQALNLMGRKGSVAKRFKAKGGWTDTNKASLEAIQDKLELHIDAVTAQHEAHENAINLLTTAQEVIDYDIQIGW